MNQQVLGYKAASDMAIPSAEMEFRLLPTRAGWNGCHGLHPSGYGLTLTDIWMVAKGRAEPDKLIGTIPHVVMAWDTIKGPEDHPWQQVTTNSQQKLLGWHLEVQQWGTRVTDTRFTSTAPGLIGRYGYDPATDTITKQTRTTI